jgi:hypothetical protein
MTEPRKPIFGFLWPKPDPAAPVDGAYRQVRRVRINPRGPVRVAVLMLGSITVTIVAATLVMAALTTTVTLATVAGGALVATGIVLVLRGWVVGTYVNDEAVTVETTWRRTSIPWASVRAITTQESPAPFLGLPVRVPSLRSVVTTSDGASLPTHVYACSPDLWLRPEAFDMARLRLERWRDER